MLGPITSEISKANKKRLEEAKEEVILNIQTLYVIPKITPTSSLQLGFPKEVMEAYTRLNAVPPQIALCKSKFLNRMESTKSWIFLIVFFFTFKWVWERDPDYPMSMTILFSTATLFLSLLFIGLGAKVAEMIYDHSKK